MSGFNGYTGDSNNDHLYGYLNTAGTDGNSSYAAMYAFTQNQPQPQMIAGNEAAMTGGQVTGNASYNYMDSMNAHHHGGYYADPYSHNNIHMNMGVHNNNSNNSHESNNHASITNAGSSASADAGRVSNNSNGAGTGVNTNANTTSITGREYTNTFAGAAPAPGYTLAMQQPQVMTLNGYSHMNGGGVDMNGSASASGYAAIDSTTNNYLAQLRQQQQHQQHQYQGNATNNHSQNRSQGTVDQGHDKRNARKRSGRSSRNRRQNSNSPFMTMYGNSQSQHQTQKTEHEGLFESMEMNNIGMNMSFGAGNSAGTGNSATVSPKNQSLSETNGNNMNGLDDFLLDSSTAAAMNALMEDPPSSRNTPTIMGTGMSAKDMEELLTPIPVSIPTTTTTSTSSAYSNSNSNHNNFIINQGQENNGDSLHQISTSTAMKKPTDILSNFTMKISSLSVEPLSAYEILDKVSMRSTEVTTKYLPCVEFLVLCQQELRQALNMVQNSRSRGRGRNGMMSTRQFFATYFVQLPNRFYSRNAAIMPMKELTTAHGGLQTLLQDVKKTERVGKHEGMKNAFLGGMRDGESWGLRKWLSKNGGALHICNDIELIWGGLRGLKKDDPMTIELAKRVRPKVKEAFDRLKQDVPKAYQEVSTAHPYLPFFHRLESCLKGLSEFDPEDDDVICLDDDSDVEEVNVPAKVSSINYGAPANCDSDSKISVNKPLQSEFASFEASYAQGNEGIQQYNDDDDDSDIEVLCVKGPAQESGNAKVTAATGNFNIDPNIFEEISKEIANPNDSEWMDKGTIDSENHGDSCAGSSSAQKENVSAQQLAEAVEVIASALEEGREVRPAGTINVLDFWSSPVINYINLLRLFQRLLLHNAARYLLDPVAESKHFRHESTRYYQLVKNPLSFREIVSAIVDLNANVNGNGKLPISTLKKWNMFEGKYFIQAMDLVFLNTLAFIGKEATPMRKEIQHLRKTFWKHIRDVGCEKKQIPIRRTENSEFLIWKKK